MTTVNAVPTETDFQMIQGATFSFQINLFDKYDNIIDLTDYGITAKFQKTYSSPAIISYTLGSGIDVGDPLNGIFTVTMQPADTATLRPVSREDETIDLVYNIELTSPDVVPVVSNPVWGTLSIQRLCN